MQDSQVKSRNSQERGTGVGDTDRDESHMKPSQRPCVRQGDMREDKTRQDKTNHDRLENI